MHALHRTALLLALLASTLAAGCAAPASQTADPADARPSLGTVVFDMGHGEVFGADDTGELGQSGAVSRIREAGFDVVVNSDTITEADLATASGLIIAGPMIPLRDEEYAAITSFVERGGTVLLTIHVPFPVQKVPAHWGLPVGTEIVMSQGEFTNPTQPSVFGADAIVPNPLTEGVTRVVVVSGWPVMAASAQAELVVSSNDRSWLSASGDQSPVPPEGTTFGSYGIIGVTRIGKGQVVVSGDDAVFANLALAEEDNARLLDNIIRAMTLASEV